MPLFETLSLTHFVLKRLALRPVVSVITEEMLILFNGLMKLYRNLSPLCVGRNVNASNHNALWPQPQHFVRQVFAKRLIYLLDAAYYGRPWHILTACRIARPNKQGIRFLDYLAMSAYRSSCILCYLTDSNWSIDHKKDQVPSAIADGLHT